jgi:hypothetical protein
MGRLIRVLLGFLLGLSFCCTPTPNIELPNKWSIYEIDVDVWAGYSVTLRFKATYENYTDTNAKVTGTIDWGDGTAEAFEDNQYVLLQYLYMAGYAGTQPYPGPYWSTPFHHTYPGPGTYVIEVVAVANYSNQPMTSTAKKEIVLTGE